VLAFSAVLYGFALGLRKSLILLMRIDDALNAQSGFRVEKSSTWLH
jgi:hypothetical protein